MFGTFLMFTQNAPGSEDVFNMDFAMFFYRGFTIGQ